MAATEATAPFRPAAGVLGLPAADLDALLTGGLTADAVVLGVPFDGGVPGLPGQRHGPELLRHHSPSHPWEVDGAGRLGGVLDPVSRRGVLTGRRVFDLGDLGSVPIDPRVPRAAYYRTLRELSAQLADHTRVPVFIGGDHSVTGPIATGLADVHGPLDLVCFDAHLDFHSRPIPDFADLTHADFIGHLLQVGAIARADVHGVRAYLPAEAGPVPPEVTSRYAFEPAPHPGAAPVHLSVDLDVIDPAEFPGTGHPEPGGYRLRELLAAVGHVCRTRRVVGVDIVEATYEEHANRVTGTTIATVLMTCLRALLEEPDEAEGDA
ncbi:arginase family protein [Saccharothrix syringae]|uniref:Arginase family protein n=1 Tax=Saccharothrix syringae TaxID=103733 RepID=A0A5Q0GQG7_SACSY|nr:arginase family protein [Saccharothrix syringae]QFZ16219.1 arginase family protein [Saccharothrix syringae]